MRSMHKFAFRFSSSAFKFRKCAFRLSLSSPLGKKFRLYFASSPEVVNRTLNEPTYPPLATPLSSSATRVMPMLLTMARTVLRRLAPEYLVGQEPLLRLALRTPFLAPSALARRQSGRAACQGARTGTGNMTETTQEDGYEREGEVLDGGATSSHGH